MNTDILPYGNISTPIKLGQAVRAKRKADGLTQAKTAAMCGVGVRFISDLENGKPTAELSKVLLVLTGLGLSLDIRPKGSAKKHITTFTSNRNNVVNNKTQQKVSNSNRRIIWRSDPTFISDTYISNLSKLTDTYKTSLNSIDKALSDLSIHRNDYLSLGIPPNAYNDIARSYKYIHDTSSTAVSSLNNAQLDISSSGLKDINKDRVLDSLNTAIDVSKGALTKLDKLQNYMSSFNLNTKATDSLKKDYKNSFNLSKSILKKITHSNKDND